MAGTRLLRLDPSLAISVCGALFIRNDPGDAGVECGGGVVVGQVSFAAGGREEAIGVVALKGEASEPFGHDWCVSVSPPDDLRNRPESCRTPPAGRFLVVKRCRVPGREKLVSLCRRVCAVECVMTETASSLGWAFTVASGPREVDFPSIR